MTGLASHVNLQVVDTEDTFLLSFLDPRLTEGPIKSPLSVRLSIRLSVRHFSEEWLIIFFF